MSDPAQTETQEQRAPPLASGAAAGLAAGQQLGHFRVERLLGAGGMGEVYLATDLALDRPVALKVLPGGAASDGERRGRLIREARAQARVAHPHVGHIYFIGEDGGRLYVAMEYVAGETLAERVAHGPLPVDEALAMIRSAALGLREAQRSGFTHRDVKPSNLMIDAHGVVKVLDFGLAAEAPRGAADAGPVAQTSLAGTPLYMAPEQARGEPIDARADIYALGATLYHLVAGAPPFYADTIEALRSLHATAARPALRRTGQPRGAVSAVASLCAKMMAPAAADRYATYDELLRALELAQLSRTRPAGVLVRSVATLLDLLASVALLGLGWLVVWLLGGSSDGDIGGFTFVALGIYAALAVGRFGRTLGQAALELEVVDIATGARPRWRRAVGRAAASVALPVGAYAVSTAVHVAGYEAAGAGAAALAIVELANFPLLLLAWFSPAKRTVWDRLSGTLVRYRTPRTATTDGLVR